MRTLTTDRLLLRPWTMDDIESLYRLCANPDIGPAAGWKPHESLEESREIVERWINGASEENTYLAMEEKETGCLVGAIGLHPDVIRRKNPRCKMTGYWVGKDYWGRGYATEAVNCMMDYAFQRLRLRMLSVYHYTDNQASRRVIEKCGFVCEGTLRRALPGYDGSYRSCRAWSMTAAEYRLRRAKEAGLSLVLPEEVSREAFFAYHDEWGGEGPHFIPGAMELKGREFEKWLEDTIAMRTRAPEGLVESTAYFFVDRAGRILGAIDFRHYLNDHLLRFGGHIGYGIRPACRGKGLAPYMLALCLEKAGEKGLTRVLVTCDDSNQASAGTIEACGGELENTVEENGRLTRRYWIEL